MNYAKVKGSECHACGHWMNCAVGYNHNGVPKLGDISICIRCDSINKFGKQMKLELVPKIKYMGAGYEDARKASEKIFLLKNGKFVQAE